MLRTVLQAVTPPIIPYAARKLTTAWSDDGRSDMLFDGDDDLFKRVVTNEAIYAEYGCGASTIWVARNVGCTIFSVDSSQAWIDKVTNECGAPSNLRLHLADFGPVGEWGTPISYDKADNFADYTDWVWSQDETPNVVLIDGRFRVSCFLTSLLKGRPETKIIFDDYTNRPHYHFVERFAKPVETCGRQALFVIPKREMLDLDDIEASLQKFRFVFA